MADEHDDDLDVGSLRSVFESMREADEEPPASGLAELMAAARAHAPKPVPWWQRITNTLRRPPVLALASVAILVGGAVVITRPGASIEKVSPQLEAPASAPTAAPEPALPRAEVRAKETVDKAKDVKAPVPPPRPRPRTMATPAAGGRMQVPEFESGAPAKADTMTRKAEERSSGELLVRNLAEKAASAATRGDCETAKALATRVAQQDPAYYRDHVAIDATIAKCLN